MDFDGFFKSQRTKNQIPGVVLALVKSTKDPDGLGRVQITFPWRGKEEDEELHWARLATLMGGNGRGMVFYPEIEDEVLVAFEHGDIDRPYIIGALWNSKDKIPEENSDGKNNIKMIKTRTGHIIKLDDTDGSEKIEIIDKTKGNKISIDSANKKISIVSAGDIELLASEGKITIDAKEIEIKSSITVNTKKIEIKSSDSAKIEASSAVMELTNTGAMNIKGSTVNIN
ncbi:MAG: phage baseplate assembly protein V [Methanosarcina barkeri]|nr:phage baseplate assembly protein V [Methanosarcina sp. ERenArc_MAG2]